MRPKAVPPTAAFARVALAKRTIPVGAEFLRIYPARFNDPLGFARAAPSRFSDSRRRKPENRFGVLYVADTFEAAFLETFVRDRRDGAAGTLLLAEAELQTRVVARLNVRAPIGAVDLTDGGSVRMGVPTDVAAASAHGLSRKWSLALHAHPECPDGIWYRSRFGVGCNVALYDRAIGRLAAGDIVPILEHPELADVLDRYRVGLL